MVHFNGIPPHVATSGGFSFRGMLAWSPVYSLPLTTILALYFSYTLCTLIRCLAASVLVNERSMTLFELPY